MPRPNTNSVEGYLEIQYGFLVHLSRMSFTKIYLLSRTETDFMFFNFIANSKPQAWA